MSDVKFPQLRAEVVEAVRALSDHDYQWRVWIRQEHPEPDWYDDFTLNVHVLFDDCRVLEAPTETIGDVLRSADEATAMLPLARALNTLFDRYGKHLSDEEYLNAPEWSTIVVAAGTALTALTMDEHAAETT